MGIVLAIATAILGAAEPGVVRVVNADELAPRLGPGAHLVPARALYTDDGRYVDKLKDAKTVAGPMVKIDTSNGVKVNNATVVKADVAASNGVIHVIDTVLLPK